MEQDRFFKNVIGILLILGILLFFPQIFSLVKETIGSVSTTISAEPTAEPTVSPESTEIPEPPVETPVSPNLKEIPEPVPTDTSAPKEEESSGFSFRDWLNETFGMSDESNNKEESKYRP